MISVNRFYKDNRGSIFEFLKFGLVGSLGTLINTGLLFLFANVLNASVVISSIIATEVSIISNFFGNHYFTFKEVSSDSVRKKFLSFQLISLLTIFGTVLILWLLTDAFGRQYLLLWNLIAIGVMFIFNFLLNKIFTWKSTQSKDTKLTMFFDSRGELK